MYLFGRALDVVMRGSGVDNIVIPPCECRLFNLETPAFYLTFNYTMVLEGMYKISPENVYHVHSSYIEKQDTGRKYVFGHSSLDTDIQKYMQKQIHDVRESIIDDWSIALGCLRKESLSETDTMGLADRSDWFTFFPEPVVRSL